MISCISRNYILAAFLFILSQFNLKSDDADKTTLIISEMFSIMYNALKLKETRVLSGLQYSVTTKYIGMYRNT